MAEKNEENYNADELVAPQWMDNAFFENILQSDENDPHLRVKEIIVKPASQVGDHFASIMFRVQVDYIPSKGKSELHSRSLIVKTMPFVESFKKEMLGESQIFDIEMKMYDEVVPAMEKLLRSVGDNTKFGPKMLYFSKEPTDVIVFEDLCKLGYTLPSGVGALVFDEAKIVFEKIGKWHAASMHLNGSGQLDLSLFVSSFFNGKVGDGIEDFMRESLEFAQDALQNCDEYKKYDSNLTNFIKNLHENGVKTYSPNSQGNGYNVLNHGDLHSKNMMIKHRENGELEDILLVSRNYIKPSIKIRLIQT